MNIKKIEGIGPVYAEKLAKAGVFTTEALLKAGATRQGRKDLAAKSGLTDHQVLEWVNRADLMRVKGVGEEYSDLLEASGVDTVRELRNRNSKNLFNKMLEVNAEKSLVRRTPTESMVEDWVSQAKKLEVVVTY